MTRLQPVTDGGWPDAEATAERIYRAYRSEVAVAISPAAWANLQDADRKFYRMVARIALADVSAAHAQAVAQAREEGARQMQDQCAFVCDLRGVEFATGEGRNIAASVEAYRCRDAILSLIIPTPSQEDRT